MKEQLVSRLIADPAVHLLAGERISWFEFPRATTGGRVLMSTVSAGREYDHDGPDGLDGPRVQFDCLAEDPDVALELADAVRQVIESGPDDVEGVRFHPGQQDTEIEDSETLSNGVVLFRVARDYQFHHEEI